MNIMTNQNSPDIQDFKIYNPEIHDYEILSTLLPQMTDEWIDNNICGSTVSGMRDALKKIMNKSIENDRKYFAATCSDSEINRRIPETIGGILDELIRRGIVPENRKNVDITRSYKPEDINKLRCLVRFEYADEMIELSKKHHS